MVAGVAFALSGPARRLPPTRFTFSVAVAIRLFYVGLFLLTSVGLFG